MTGELSCGWLLQKWRDEGKSPISHHDTWKTSSRIPEGDRAIHEHYLLCRALFELLVVDQCNAPALKSAELLCRRLQLIEEAYRVNPSNPDYSGCDHWMGWGAMPGGTTVSPALRRHVAGEMKAEAEVAKESRKAREEKKLASSKKRPKKPKGGGKGAEEEEG